ncbi:bifunctional proline dehydrogenase/L-glutamate gamma-semialdehyde dehydrogenase PutA [Sneathiella limimaris]|uniref:bifunctional proline dehydrogenase/L-glutamate gamma-semialdehyde dehydrogenase PutA n=1 Tax=Sneathiella limimaris TaxID=1964213 RepID=UPI00146A5AEA|nr:bifunctional proline dehydrogenase/L-glutamate gamma-semialdehyde dehydrogenase PutA [Sneathiella limimaris]
MLQSKQSKLPGIRALIREHHISDERRNLETLIDYLDITHEQREEIVDEATEFVRLLRKESTPGMMETFLSEYGLSTEEGVALMCLAEALLRVPDEETIDVLIHDKIASADWSQHLGHSASPLVNVSTWALMLTGKVISLEEREKWDVVTNVRKLVKRAGEPVIRKAVGQAMRTLGHQFVLGRDIQEAMGRARSMEEKGYTYSYDMLGEAARTAKDATRYFNAYSRAISELSEAAVNEDIRDNPGISIKLSALHPRYEFGHKERVMKELVPRVVSLAMQAKNAGMGFNIDAEEANRLDLSLDVIEAVLSVSDLAGWDGFGVVVQAYGPRAFYVLDWCYSLATELDRKIMIRLVKGAYWDTEIKVAQVEGLEGYPVFTRKSATDVSYMACAKKLLSMTDRIYPQFATHNAHTVMSVLNMATDLDAFEFQRLHGMGEALHGLAKQKNKTRCRIYAPVGIHEDLLAYLVRRLLENGANSSFVNQVFDEKVPPRQVVRDPIEVLMKGLESKPNTLPLPLDIYPEGRKNSLGRNFSNPDVQFAYEASLQHFSDKTWLAGTTKDAENLKPIFNPADFGDRVGSYLEADRDVVQQAYERARSAVVQWENTSVQTRADVLRKIADLYEENSAELMAILTREAAKIPLDALNEVREAVDFCRYYADRAEELTENTAARGVFVCISPWNFPLAIFTGQIVAALVAGNTVLAKPAPQTPLIGGFAVELMHKAGIPKDNLHLLVGGVETGQALTELEGLDGICFTGSTLTAQKIHQVMAETAKPTAPLIAETGGLNAMLVDSTALPEQAVRDIVASAFQSAGQRCSALRILYVQEDVKDRLLTMLKGAMDELTIGKPGSFATDVGPVIDEAAQANINSYVESFKNKGAILKQVDIPQGLSGKGYFVAPALIEVDGIQDMEREIFGPVLHVATYKAGELEMVISDINAAGYGLTLGLHTRVDARVAEVAEQAHVGNVYVNRNQIGAVVGVQPFGGEGLSGTGPKAGGPLYLHKFQKSAEETGSMSPSTSLEMAHSGIFSLLKAWHGERSNLEQQLMRKLQGYGETSQICPGPTGESNQLTLHPRGRIALVGEDWHLDLLLALATGNTVILQETVAGAKELMTLMADKPEFSAQIEFCKTDLLDLGEMQKLELDAICFSTDNVEHIRGIRKVISQLPGKLVPVLESQRDWREFVHERCLSVDTTASGGNAALLAASAE